MLKQIKVEISTMVQVPSWLLRENGNYDLEKMWYKLHLIFDYNLGINYLDCKSTEEEVNLINRLTTNAPDCVRHLNGFPLSRQLYIVKTLFDKFKNDPIIAISILETYCIDYNVDIENEMDLLLLELSVRKKILDDPRDKVRKILQTDSEDLQVQFEIYDMSSPLAGSISVAT
jgi:hypothetical protein